MNTSEILSFILQNEELSVQEFANLIGYPVSKLYDIKQGRTKKFSEDLMSLISYKFPKYNRDFLLTGTMPLEQQVNQVIKQMQSTDEKNDNFTLLINELSATRRDNTAIIQKYQSQLDEMIQIIKSQLKII